MLKLFFFLSVSLTKTTKKGLEVKQGLIEEVSKNIRHKVLHLVFHSVSEKNIDMFLPFCRISFC